MYVCMSLCFVRTVRNLKPHVRSAAQTDVLIYLLMGLTVSTEFFTFGQRVMTVHNTREM